MYALNYKLLTESFSVWFQWSVLLHSLCKCFWTPDQKLLRQSIPARSVSLLYFSQVLSCMSLLLLYKTPCYLCFKSCTHMSVSVCFTLQAVCSRRVHVSHSSGMCVSRNCQFNLPFGKFIIHHNSVLIHLNFRLTTWLNECEYNCN